MMKEIVTPRDAINVSQKLLDGGQIDQAIEVISNAQSIWKKNKKIQAQRGFVLSRSGKHEEGMLLINSVINESPEIMFCHEKLIEIFIVCKEWEKALHAVQRALGKDSDSKSLLMSLARIYEGMENYGEAALVWKQISLQDSDKDVVAGLLKCRYFSGELSKGAEEYKEHCKSVEGKVSHKISHFGALLTRKNGDFSEAEEIIKEQLKRTMNARKKSRYAKILLAYGSLNDALQVFTELEDDSEVGSSALYFSKITQKLLKNVGNKLVSPPINPREGYVYHRNVESDKVLIVFNGHEHTVGSIPINVFQHFMEGQKVNIIYLIDSQHVLYMQGIPQLGNDFNETVASLRSTLKDWGINDVYCLGTSGGGYAAILYSLELQARAVLAFSAPASMEA
ncbi:MAG: hypothetical protein OEY89_18100, partial [Gammaproteobacteria bacterium]|nr:hypothetical protein [Gammaproteobacteria bacterium]